MHLRQVDMLQDGIAKSSATLSMMSKKTEELHHYVNRYREWDYTQNIERAWQTYKREVWRMRGNRSEKTLKKQLSFIEWTYWLARTYKHGVLGRLIKDIRNANHR
ncbi:hypothetical protein F7725_012008 [Dissostichus mawsoni]|uniref:Uncharacterized protein n=1 Tax=Dissostichus mawsoni TaxID=36200 RepID=A0A7J5ZDL4_DISMA|nr:hypothetical protein F7725_012008 [Dissostichus mawsoni]